PHAVDRDCSLFADFKRMPEDAPFLSLAFSLRRRSSSAFSSSSDMVLPSLLIRRGEVYRELSVQGDRDEAVCIANTGVGHCSWRGCARRAHSAKPAKNSGMDPGPTDIDQFL